MTELPFRYAKEKVDRITHIKSHQGDPISPGQRLIRRYGRNCEENMEEKILKDFA